MASPAENTDQAEPLRLAHPVAKMRKRGYHGGAGNWKVDEQRIAGSCEVVAKPVEVMSSQEVTHGPPGAEHPHWRSSAGSDHGTVRQRRAVHRHGCGWHGRRGRNRRGGCRITGRRVDECGAGRGRGTDNAGSEHRNSGGAAGPIAVDGIAAGFHKALYQHRELLLNLCKKMSRITAHPLEWEGRLLVSHPAREALDHPAVDAA